MGYEPCDHGFTANKDFFFISNEFDGRTNVKQNKRIINGKSKRKKEKKYFKTTEERETGNSKNKYKININNFKINLYKSIPNFEKCDTINENKKFKIFSNFYLPIQIEKTTYIEKQEVEITLRNR